MINNTSKEQIVVFIGIWKWRCLVQKICQNDTISRYLRINDILLCLWGFGCRMVQNVQIRIGHYTRPFTLVAKWEVSPEWHKCNICHPRDKFVLHFYTFQIIFSTLFFHYETDPHSSDIRAIYVTPAPYATPANDIHDKCGDIYG